MSKLSETVSFSELNINRRTLNGDLRGARNKTMLSIIGQPRSQYDDECRRPTNKRIADMMETVDFGPFRATGLGPAVDTLRKIMAEIKKEHPQIHDALSTAGMSCSRLVRGSKTAISNHSWGTAIDLKLEGKLDRRGDNRTQRGLLEIYRIFNRHGFFWGAAFTTEDSMHFEASDQLVRSWAKDGLFGDTQQPSEKIIFDFGDRGPEIEALQKRLNAALAFDLEEDGIFGKDTRAAVMEFERRSNFPIDGLVDDKTHKALIKATAKHDF